MARQHINLSIWDPQSRAGRSTYNVDRDIARWVYLINTEGAAIVETRHARSFRNMLGGRGDTVQHYDAQFSETGNSYAAWLENNK